MSSLRNNSLLDSPHAEVASETVDVANLPSVYAMPATQGQVRFWSLDQLDPGNPALNMPLMWQFTGPLDVDALRQAFAGCMERHEMLRTTFEVADTRVSQIIHPQMAMPIPVVDLSMLSGEAQRAGADRVTRAHAAFRFDLKAGPLLELKLLKLGPQMHVLLVTMHHIICDGISNGILMRDMIAFYETLVTGSSSLELPELPIQFADYAIWQEEWRNSPEAAASLSFWHEALGSDFAPIELAHDVDATTVRTDGATGDIETLLLPRELTARAHAFCIRENVTFNMLLFSVFAALISRLTQQKDFTIGSPCANRTEDTAELIGLFMNIQVLRIRLEKTSRFHDLLQQVQNWTVAAYENQELPFEALVHDSFFSEGEKSFQIPIFFLYQKSFMLIRRIGDLEIVPLRSESPGAVFDMMFAIVDREEEGPRLQLEYNPQSYKATTIQRILRLYVNLLDSAITTPARLVDELEMLSTAERRQLINGANDTAVSFGNFEAAHTLFLRQAASTPDRTAAECGGSIWTYAELAAYSKALAARLLREGLVPGAPVALYMDRSLEMVGAMLAVMMAGGAYVPLDPRHPRLRVEAILADCGASLLLAGRDVELATSAMCLNIREVDATHDNTRLPQPLPAHIAPESLAYVIYTSGTTGVPKGVAIQHGSLINLLHSMVRKPGLAEDDVLVAITTVSFDIAALELLAPLITGARLVIATDQQAQTPKLLLPLLKASKATVLQATPGAWRALMDQGWSTSLPLRVWCGGEAMSRPLADKLLERSSQVWNLYGPTETTIWSSVSQVSRGTGNVSIGTPIANTQLYILDDQLQPVPVGVTGTLYIAGAGLARGYWNKPELTAEKFVPNPFGAGKMYHTGDLARWTPNLTVELLGRSDYQVKIRGYRIELGEIEAALQRHPSVREAVVVLHKINDQPDRPGVTRLIAYVEGVDPDAEEHAATLTAELQAFLAQSLPEYMTPNALVVLQELPRNTNGKIDRKVLPDVFGKAGDKGLRNGDSEPQAFLGPRDVIERQLTDIWQTTLGIPKISIRASFFSLGVGSLAALRLITKMNRVYATDLGLASLISASTIESIAELIRKRFSPNTTSAVVAIQPFGTKPPLFILHGVGGNIVSFFGLAMRMGKNQPVYAIQAQSLLSGRPALVDMKDMAAYYIEEVRKVQPEGPYNFLGYSFGGFVALEMAQQLRAAGHEVGVLGMLDSRSKQYAEDSATAEPVGDKVNRRLSRFRGNTTDLDWKMRFRYLCGKAWTRAIRFSYMAAARLKIARMPSFMKSAYDVNYVALENYKVEPYDGRMTLFRAEHQDFANAPRDLGWSAIFKQGVKVYDLPGDHERIFLEPNIDMLANDLRESLG